MPLSYDTLRAARDGAVLTLTMDRPAKRNALSPPLDEDLRAAFSDGEATDSDVRAVVLTGAGEGFCSGADLSAFEDLPDPDAVEAYLKEHYLPLIEALTTLEKPVIAAVNGAAAGAGAALALACDLRVMDEEAALVVAFSSVGLVPDMGTTWFLARHPGYGRAYELCATGEAVEATRCEAMGLANRVVPPGELTDRAAEWATELAARPTRALGLTKKALYYAMSHSLSESIEREAELQREASATRDHREGVEAFLQKREPQFEGW
jgi:2-(1,2-epoxy-1,2-dihydrophenyl)acetyl-CoA isomerase